MAFQKNYIVVGNPTISNDFIASNFSDGSYLKVVRDWEDTFTVHTKIRTPSSWQAGYSCLFEFNTSIGNLSVNLERNFIIWSYSQKKDVSVLTPQLNTDYYIRWTIDFPHNEKRFSYSLDNNVWSDEIIVQDSQMNKGENVALIIGNTQRFDDSWSGSVDLNNTFITVGENIVWKAVKDVGIIPGSVTISKGYYNADGTNIIKFTEDITKTLTEAANQVEWKNYVFLTLDQQDQSSFVIHNDWSPLQGSYKASKKLETTSIYLDPSLNYILGTEPTSIEYQVTPQNPGGTDDTAGSVSFTQGWLYNQTQNRTYQNKDTAPVSVEQLKENNAEGATIGYKNSLALKFDQSSDVSLPVIFSTAGNIYNYNFNQDIYLDNTKTKLLGTTAVSDSWVVEPNYTVVGSPTVSDNGDATGFSDSNYLTIQNYLTANMVNFTLITSFTTTNNTVPNSGIFDSDIEASGGTNIRLTITDSKLRFRISTTGAYTYPVDITGTTTIENNKKYWAKVEYKADEGYSTYLSEDGQEWNLEASSTVKDRPFSGNYNNIIGDNLTAGSYFEGTLHLADWSITVDGVKVWEYLKKSYSINTGTSATDTGSITYTAGYRYIDEINGSFFISQTKTKTFEELTADGKAEMMKLVLGIKQDGTTDFFLSAGLLPPDYKYTEDVCDVYLDRTLSYIYGTTADPRKTLTVQVAPDTYGIRLEELNHSPLNWTYGTGTATLALDAGGTVSVSIHNVETNPNTYMFEEVVNEDTIKTYEMAALTINATPDTALIDIMYGPDDQPSFNHGTGTITCPLPVGTQIQWTVSADGYVSQSGTQIVSSDLTLPITLESSTVETYTLSVSTDPADANIEISGDYEEILAEKTEPYTMKAYGWTPTRYTSTPTPTTADSYWSPTGTCEYFQREDGISLEDAIIDLEADPPTITVKSGRYKYTYTRDTSLDGRTYQLFYRFQNTTDTNDCFYIKKISDTFPPDSSSVLYSFDNSTGLQKTSRTLTEFSYSAPNFTDSDGKSYMSVRRDWFNVETVEEEIQPAERTEPTLPTQTFWRWYNAESPGSTAMMTVVENPTAADYIYNSDAVTTNSDPFSCKDDGTSFDTIENSSTTVSGTTLTRGGITFTRVDEPTEYTKCSYYMGSNMESFMATADSDNLFQYDTTTGEFTITDIPKGTEGYELVSGYWVKSSVVENPFSSPMMYAWKNEEGLEPIVYTDVPIPSEGTKIYKKSSSTEASYLEIYIGDGNTTYDPESGVINIIVPYERDPASDIRLNKIN